MIFRDWACYYFIIVINNIQDTSLAPILVNKGHPFNFVIFLIVACFNFWNCILIDLVGFECVLLWILCVDLWRLNIILKDQLNARQMMLTSANCFHFKKLRRLRKILLLNVGQGCPLECQVIIVLRASNAFYLLNLALLSLEPIK